LDGIYLEATDRFVVSISRATDLHRHAIRLLNTLPVDQPITSLALIAGKLGAGTGEQRQRQLRADARQMPAAVGSSGR
jgi:hypothetical protein